MAISWFIALYKRRDIGGTPGRYCAVDDFTAQIRADGGDWSETEVLGDAALVKVSASAATLVSIASAPGMFRIPLARLDLTLGDLTAGQRAALRDRIVALGYTLAELDAAIPGGLSASTTLGQVLRFAASRRVKPRYDPGTDEIVFDTGETVTPLSPDVVDGLVR